MLPLLLPKTPPPQTLWLTIVYIFSTGVCLLGMYSACWPSVHAHAHHLGHKVSSVPGTWVL